MSRQGPGGASSWVPSRVEGEPIWYSDDGSFVLLRRDSWERLHIRLLVPPADLPRPLDDLGHAPTPPPADTTDEAPTVVQTGTGHQGWSPAEPAEVSEQVFSGGDQHGRPVITTRVVSQSTEPDMSVTTHRRLNLGLFTLSVVLLSVAAGVWIGSDLSSRVTAAPTSTPAAPAVAPTVAPTPGAPAPTAPTPAPSAAPTAEAPATPAIPAAPTPAAPTPAAPTAAPTPPSPTATVTTPASAPTATPVAPRATPQAPPTPPRPAPTPAAPVAPPSGVWGTTAPPPPPPAQPAATVDMGWELVERDPRRAADTFRAVLSARPADPEAHYGLGYALLKLGDRTGATTHLCRARSGPASTQREVAGLLQTHDLSCD